MTYLHIDFETKSQLDVKKVGLDNYARAATPLLMAWAFGDDYPIVYDFQSLQSADGDFPYWEQLTDSSITKVAWNSGFEQAIFKECLGIDIPDEQWLDPSVIARYCSLPGHLAQCGEALGLGESEAKQKAAGTRLINKFSKPLKSGGFADQNTHPEDWKLFVEYCRQDVIAERNIFKRLSKFQLTPFEQRVYLLDQKINRRGLPVSLEFVEAAKRAANAARAEGMRELQELTGLANPNSPKQLLGWLKERGYPYGSLGAPKIRKALAEEKNG